MPTMPAAPVHATPTTSAVPETASPTTTPLGLRTASPASPAVGRPAPSGAAARRVVAVLARGVGLALLVGALGGLAARLLMRFFAVALGHETGFSWPGTIGVVMVYTVAMVPGALAVAATRRRWRWLPLTLGVLFLWYGSALNALADLPGDLPAGVTATLVVLGLAFLLTPAAQAWGLVRLADRRRRSS